MSKNVPFWSVPAHIFETSGWNNITFGSQGDHIRIIHSFSDIDLGMVPCDIELFQGGGPSAGRPFSFELKTLGEKVGYCQSLPSDLVLLGASFSVYCMMSANPARYSRWRQIHLKSQMFHSNLQPLRLLQ